jgi:5-methyltetrahydropteroyltriglutamate--homocysteine methyltransferase
MARFLTTHTGSLPRPDDLSQMMADRAEGRPIDEAALQARIPRAIKEIVDQQIETGIDLINDGEQSKISYTTYVAERLTGFEGRGAWMARSDREDFPQFAAWYARNRGYRPPLPLCVGPVALKDPNAVQRDLANLRAALNGRQPAGVFVTAASPGQIARFLANDYYPSHEAYLDALATAMKPEYDAIAASGFTLQLDCPDLASGRNNQFADLSLEGFRKMVALHVEVLNAATAAIPPQQMRMHVCWGNYNGPHHRDVPLGDILDILLSARPHAISFEAANPRHEHEWTLFEDVKLPEGKKIIPGVLDSTTSYIEHPELVAQRLQRFASLVGAENVIAGSDCGYSTFVGDTNVVPEIAWAKLAAMVEGARLASANLSF